MIRFLFILLLLVAAFVAGAWYTAQSLPSWYEQEKPQSQRVANNLSEEIKKKGVGSFLGGKFAEVMNGELNLSETEFNALMLASLQSSKGGRRLLAVSDGVNAQLRNDELEIGAVVDLKKLAATDAKSKKAVDKLTDALPFLSNQKLSVAISGTPIARDGNIAFDQDLSLTIGSVPIPNSVLKSLGVPVERATQESLPLKYLKVTSVNLKEDQITLGVLPSF